MNRMMEGSAEKRILLTESWDKEHAMIETRNFAAGAGFNKTQQMLIATAASELSSNILRYAGKGELLLKVVKNMGRLGIEIVAMDQGTGIADIEKALQDNYTTTKGSLGLGLPSVRRIMDDFEIESSPGKGTLIRTRKWRDYSER